MKLITPEEEKAHYNAVVTGGAVGGVVGLGLGWGGAIWATRRYPAFRNLTLPFKAFLVSSSATFGAIVEADRWSMHFEKSRDPNRFYRSEDQKLLEEARAQMTPGEQLLSMAREHRYKIVLASWLASMATSMTIVGRSKYLSAAQKIVQARVYAQGLTLVVLVATAALELSDAKSGSGRWETVRVVDPNDPEHKKMIEKKIHKEEYEGQDLWKGKLFSSPLRNLRVALLTRSRRYGRC